MPDNKGLNDYARYSGMAFEILALTLIMVYLGKKLDLYFNNTRPLMVVLLVCFGIIGYTVKIYYETQKENEISKINAIRSLVFLTVISIFLLVGFYFILKSFHDILLSAIYLIFLLLSTILFIFSIVNSLDSKNKMTFIQITMVNVIAKIIGTVIILVSFIKIAGVVSKTSIIPFILIYLIYFVYETFFVYRLAKSK